MAHLRYKFNPETLLFEISHISKRRKVMRVLRGFLVSLLLAVGYYVIYIQFFDTPHSLALHRSNADLVVKFDLLDKRIQEANNFLTQIQRRDNNVYRATFGLDIIPSSVRDAGFGGVNRYAHFEKSEYASTLINTSKHLDVLMKKAYIQSISFDTIAKLAVMTERMTDCIPAIQPIAIGKNNVRITDVFRVRVDPIYGDVRMHSGMDFGGNVGAPVFATGDGKVIATEHSFFGYGNSIVIDHGFGYTTRYAHLYSIGVRQGQMVKRGEKIGTLGNTGKSTAPHLHYEVHYLDRPQNPINYFSSDVDLEEYEKILKTAQGHKNFD